jgi:hypothetical protein
MPFPASSTTSSSRLAGSVFRLVQAFPGAGQCLVFVMASHKKTPVPHRSGAQKKNKKSDYMGD